MGKAGTPRTFLIGKAGLTTEDLAMHLFKRMILIVPVLAISTSSMAKPRTMAPQIDVSLGAQDIDRLLKAIPELSSQADGYQGQFLGGMTGGAVPKKIKKSDIENIERIIKKYGFDPQAFALQASVLVATYFTLRPKAFERQLPSAENPLIRIRLENPKLTDKERKRILKQIDFVQANKEKLREQLEMLVSDANKTAVRPHLDRIAKALSKAESAALKRAKSEAVAAR